MRRGTWEKPRLTGIDVIVVVVSLVTQAVVRSWDYSTGQDQITASLTLIEEAFALWIWGMILGGLALSLIVGMLLKIHLMVWAAHSLLGCVYFVLMIGMLISILAQNPYPWDGIRAVTLLMTPTVLHGVVAIRMGPSPLPYENSQVHEAVIKENG